MTRRGGECEHGVIVEIWSAEQIAAEVAGVTSETPVTRSKISRMGVRSGVARFRLVGGLDEAPRRGWIVAGIKQEWKVIYSSDTG